MMNASGASSTRPYLIRALYEWCSDNGLTPYVAVKVDDTVRVPREYVKDGEIVLNVSMDATSSLKLGNDYIEFKARFGGVARDIMIPIGRVMAIYARESGQGMAFPHEEEPAQAATVAGVSSGGDASAALTPATPVAGLSGVETPRTDLEEPDPTRPAGGGRPALKRVK